MWKVCLFCSQNNKMVWLSNMADTFLEKCTRCAKVCGLLFLDCAFGMLIGWARKSRSHGTEREFVFLHFSTFVWIENDGESVKPTQTSPNERLLQTLWDFTDRDCDNLESRREQQWHLHLVGTLDSTSWVNRDILLPFSGDTSWKSEVWWKLRV